VCADARVQGRGRFLCREHIRALTVENIFPGMVSGRMEAKSFRQWQQKADELAFIRKAMAPLGGRRDKQIVREYFKEWKAFIESVLGDKKLEAQLKEYFKKWKEASVKSLHLKKVKEIIRAMLLGNSLSVNFGVWKDIWQTNKDKVCACVNAFWTSLLLLSQSFPPKCADADIQKQIPGSEDTHGSVYKDSARAPHTSKAQNRSLS
jgi:hypothetical protein